MISVLSLAAFACSPSYGTDSSGDLPDPIKDIKVAPPKAELTKEETDKDATPKMAEVVLAGGCFWCVEAVFEPLAGVSEVISGYAGDSKEMANYNLVSTGNTKHAEVVKIVYDPNVISYGQLLKVFFSTHDPTTLNRQGADVGSQYRSAVFYANEEEKAVAKAYIDQLNEAKVFADPIVTTLEPLKDFYVAEDYHQNFVDRNPNQGYVRAVAMPKVEKVKTKFKDKLKNADQ